MSATGSRARPWPRRSFTLDAGALIDAIGAGGGERRPRLPHGECGVWGSAPRGLENDKSF